MSWRLVGTSPPYVELGPGSCSRLGEERGDKPRPRHAIRGVCTGCLVSYQSPPETAGMGRCRDRFCGFFNLIVSLSFFFFRPLAGDYVREAPELAHSVPALAVLAARCAGGWSSRA